MANKRSAASSRGRDLFRTEVSSLLADLSELAGEQGSHPVPAETPPAAAEPAGEALGPVAHGTDADADAAPSSGGEAAESPAPPEQDGTPDEDLISLSPSYLPPLPPLLSPLTAAPEPAAPAGRGSSAAEPAPPPGAWAAAPEPEAPPELWPEMGPPQHRTSPPEPEVSAPWPSPPDPVALPGEWALASQPAAAPGDWGAPPEPPAAPADWVSPPEPVAALGLWPFMSDLSTAAGGWDQWPERSAAPDSPTSSPEPAGASEQWVSPPAHEPPATGQGWPPPPGDAGTAPAPGSGWAQPPGPPPAVEWPSTAAGAPEEGVLGPAVLPPVWGSDDLIEMSAPPAPPPAPAAGIADAKLPTGDITAAELAAQDQSAPAWRRSPSSQPSRLPTLAELPGWRLDGPVRGAASVPVLTGGLETDRSQRFRAAPPSYPAASGERDGSTVDQAAPSTPGVSPETAVATGSTVDQAAPSAPDVSPATAVATGPPADRSEPAPEGGGERTPQAPPAPIPATTAASAAPVPTTASSGPVAAGRPGLPLLPGGQPAPVSTRPWTLASAMQPLAPMAPPAIRTAGASLPEPAGPVLSRGRSSGVNLPFAVVVAALVAVLAVIVVLILLNHHH
jgi:hypothetical protein